MPANARCAASPMTASCAAQSAHIGPCWCARVEIPDELLARVPVELRDAPAFVGLH